MLVGDRQLERLRKLITRLKAGGTVTKRDMRAVLTVEELAAHDADWQLDPSGKCGGVLHRLHCLCLELNGACEGQCRVPTVWIIEPVDVSGYGGFSLAS